MMMRVYPRLVCFLMHLTNHLWTQMKLCLSYLSCHILKEYLVILISAQDAPYSKGWPRALLSLFAFNKLIIHMHNVFEFYLVQCVIGSKVQSKVQPSKSMHKRKRCRKVVPNCCTSDCFLLVANFVLRGQVLLFPTFTKLMLRV